MFGRRKEEEIFRPKKERPRREKKRRLPKVKAEEDLSAHFGENVEAFTEQDAYPDSFLPSDPPEEKTVGKLPKPKKEKKQRPEKQKKPPSEAPFYRSRLVIGTACVTVACIIAFVLVPVMSYVTGTEMTTVAVMTAPLGKGKRIEASMIRIEQVPAQGLPDGALKDEKLAVGKYAAVDLVAGDTLLASKLTESIPFPNSYLYEIPDGQQAISATIQSFADGLSGKLLAGDVVSVYAVPNQTDMEETDYLAIQPPELRFVRVLAVTSQLGADRQRDEPEDSDKDRKDAGDKENQPATVTLLVKPEQAAAVAGLEVNARLHLALVSRGNEQAAQSYLQTQEDYLKDAAKKEDQELQDLLQDESIQDLLNGGTDYSGLNPEKTESGAESGE